MVSTGGEGGESEHQRCHRNLLLGFSSCFPGASGLADSQCHRLPVPEEKFGGKRHGFFYGKDGLAVTQLILSKH